MQDDTTPNNVSPIGLAGTGARERPSEAATQSPETFIPESVDQLLAH
jgi:hypothetical protein